jgi:hypothetical protein
VYSNSGLAHQGPRKGADSADEDDTQGAGASRAATKAVEDIPMRTAYFFNRWMWIHYPLIAVGNCRNRYKRGIDLNREGDDDMLGGALSEPSQSSSIAGRAKSAVGDKRKEKKEPLLRRPQTAGGRRGAGPEGWDDVDTIKVKKTRAFVLPEPLFRRKAKRSFRRVPKESDETNGDGDGEYAKRLTTLLDTIQSTREEYDFNRQRRSGLEKQMYELQGKLVDLQRASDSNSHFDGLFSAVERRAARANEKRDTALSELENLKAVYRMCSRHPPGMPPVVSCAEEKIQQDTYLLGEIKARLFEQFFENQTHHVNFKRMKELTSQGMKMHTMLLDYRSEARARLTIQGQEDVAMLRRDDTAQFAIEDLPRQDKEREDVRIRSESMTSEEMAAASQTDHSANVERAKAIWMQKWQVIQARTGITEPEIFFERMEKSKVLESQMEGLKKFSEQKLDQCKQEAATTEAGLDELVYEASFVVAARKDPAGKKHKIVESNVKLKHSRERCEQADVLLKGVVEGLRHIGELLGLTMLMDKNQEHQEDSTDVNVSELCRDIEMLLEKLVEEWQRQEAALQAQMTNSLDGSGGGLESPGGVNLPTLQFKDQQSHLPPELNACVNRMKQLQLEKAEPLTQSGAIRVPNVLYSRQNAGDQGEYFEGVFVEGRRDGRTFTAAPLDDESTVSFDDEGAWNKDWVKSQSQKVLRIESKRAEKKTKENEAPTMNRTND